MNVVCRLMCREEIESAMRGEDVKKGDKGEQIYEHIVGNQLSFSPIKYCDMVSLGDLTVILANMKNFFITHSVKEARARNSKVYMVVLRMMVKLNILLTWGVATEQNILSHRKSY